MTFVIHVKPGVAVKLISRASVDQPIMFLSIQYITFAALLPTSFSFSVNHGSDSLVMAGQEKYVTKYYPISRRESLIDGLVALGTAVVAVGTPSPAVADVASGDELPKGAQQFNRIIRLRSDLKVCRFVVPFAMIFIPTTFYRSGSGDPHHKNHLFRGQGTFRAHVP